MRADKELSDVWCGREGERCVSSEGAARVGGTQCLSGFGFSGFLNFQERCDLVWTLAMFTVPDCLQLQTSHSSTFHSHSVDSWKVHGCAESSTKVCRSRIPLDIRSDSQCLMSWCACRVSELVGDGQGELDLIFERKCLNLASWVEWRYLIQQVYTKCLYSCHCTAHCTLPSVCHSDQLENITAATNKSCDTRRQSLSDIPIIRVLPPPPAERGRSPSGPRLSVSDEAKWSLLKWPERTHYYNIKFLSSDIISH